MWAAWLEAALRRGVARRPPGGWCAAGAAGVPRPAREGCGSSCSLVPPGLETAAARRRRQRRAALAPRPPRTAAGVPAAEDVDAAAVLLAGLSRALAALPSAPAPGEARDGLKELLGEVQLQRQELAGLAVRLDSVSCEQRMAFLRSGKEAADLQGAVHGVEGMLARYHENMERLLLELMSHARMTAPLPQIGDLGRSLMMEQATLAELRREAALVNDQQQRLAAQMPMLEAQVAQHLQALKVHQREEAALWRHGLESLSGSLVRHRECTERRLRELVSQNTDGCPAASGR